MATQNELDSLYMSMAWRMAQISKAKRLHVGAVLLLPSGVLVPSVNGMPKQLGNDCEEIINGEIVTKPEVIHAEEQIINKCSLEGLSSKNGILYCTHSCCRHCSSRIIASGIVEYVYSSDYRDSVGIDNLKKSGIIVRKIDYKGVY